MYGQYTTILCITHAQNMTTKVLSRIYDNTDKMFVWLTYKFFQFINRKNIFCKMGGTCPSAPYLATTIWTLHALHNALAKLLNLMFISGCKRTGDQKNH